jgi:hypothetical protein
MQRGLTMRSNLPKAPPYLIRHFETARLRGPYGAELSNVVDDIIAMRRRSGEAVNDFHPSFNSTKISA